MISNFGRSPFLCRWFGHKWGNVYRTSNLVETHQQRCTRKGCGAWYKYYFNALNPHHKIMFQDPSPEWNELAQDYRNGDA